MYRLALASLLVLALMQTATACPPAQSRVTNVNGQQVRQWYCSPGKVLFNYQNVHRCFERCDYCPNGFCHENKCHCFPGTHEVRPGVCGKICGNCQNGWCSSTSKCECNAGFTRINGRCRRGYQQAPPGYPYWYPPGGYPGLDPRKDD